MIFKEEVFEESSLIIFGLMSFKMKKYQNINIIGAGRLGLALAQALNRVGFSVRCLIDKRKESLNRARERQVAQIYSENLFELQTADIIFICVNDDQIGFVLSELTDVLKEKKVADFAFHCSGALSAAALDTLREFDIKIGSMHPIQTLAGTVEDYEKLFGIYFALEGDDEAISAARFIVQKLSGKSIVLSELDKTTHHLACTFAANYVNFLISIVVKLYEEIGIDEKRAREMVRPLVLSSVENSLEKGVENSITGPAARGDVGTIEKHLEILKEKFPEFEKIYKLLGKRIFDYSSILKNLDKEKIQRMRELFNL